MSDTPLQIDVCLDPAEVAKSNFCDGILKILNAVRPKWFSTEDAIFSLKTKASNFKILTALIVQQSVMKKVHLLHFITWIFGSAHT